MKANTTRDLTSKTQLAERLTIATGILAGIALIIILGIIIYDTLSATISPIATDQPSTSISSRNPELSAAQRIDNPSSQLILSIPTPNSFKSRLVLDQSYWRLVRKGEARILPGTEQYLESQLVSDQDPLNLANFIDVDLTNLDSLQKYRLAWFNVYGQFGTQYGGVICRLHDANNEVVVSIPTLSAELQALAEQRGDHYFFVSSTCKETGLSSTFLQFYQGDAQIMLIQPNDAPLLAFPTVTEGQVSYQLHIQDNSVKVAVRPDDQESTIEIVDQLSFNRAGQLFATSTHVEASPEQTQIISAALTELESRPLSQGIISCVLNPN